MVSKGRHPKNEINGALDALDNADFEVTQAKNGHTWGFVTCRKCGKRQRIWSTPKNPGNDANHIRQFSTKHEHNDEES